MGKISRGPRNVIDIIIKTPLYLGEWGGELILRRVKIRKNDVFLTYEGVIGS